MKNMKSYGYVNYGPIPQNEYTNANSERTADTTAVLGPGLPADDAAHERRLIKRHTMHPSGRRKIRGWSRSWKANGWRAESAALHDETNDIGRSSDYDRKNNPSF